MKHKILLLLAISFFATGFNRLAAQRKTGQALIDSLKQDLLTTEADTQRCKLLGRIAFAYGAINADEGIKYGTEALNLARQINWEKGVANALYYRGSCYLYASRYPEAIDDYLKSLQYFEKVNNRDRMAGLLSNIGGVYIYQKKNEKALEYLLKALEINRADAEQGSSFEVANLGNIGIIYYEEKNFDKSLQYHQEALQVCEKGGYTDVLPGVLIGISDVYLEMKDYAQALAYGQRAMAASRAIGDATTSAHSYITIGAATFRTLSNGSRDLDKTNVAHPQKALAYAKICLDSAVIMLQQQGDNQQLIRAYEELSKLEEYKGNIRGALDYFKLYKAIGDTVYNAGNKERILQTAMEYDFEKREAATRAEQEKKDIQQRNIRNFITAGLIVLLFITGLVMRQRNRMAKEKKRSEALLLNILPEEVASELKAKGRAEARQFNDATVMFTDFKGFTQIAERLSAAELVGEIDFYFKAFDDIISRYNIEKIKTIGDSYMCAAGLPVPNASHAADVVRAALEIQAFVASCKEERISKGLPFFEIRIGVNSGSVVAGIVGNKKFAYDIWGDAVNIASKMESSGEAGKVNISGSTYELVKDIFPCTHRGKVEAKNKGHIEMYFVA